MVPPIIPRPRLPRCETWMGHDIGIICHTTETRYIVGQKLIETDAGIGPVSQETVTRAVTSTVLSFSLCLVLLYSNALMSHD